MEGSNRAMEGSNRTMEGSNRTMEGSNRTMEGSNRAMEGSNRTMEGSNRAMEGSNRTMEGSNRAMEGSNRAMEGSNRAMEGSNRAMEGSNRTMEGSNRPMDGSNRPMEGSNRTMEGSNRTRRRRQKKGTRANDVRKTPMSPDVTGRMIDRTSTTDVNGQLIDRASTEGQWIDRASTEGQMIDRASTTDVNGQLIDRASTEGQLIDRASTDGQLIDRTSMLSSVTASVSSPSLSSGGGSGHRRLVVRGPSPSQSSGSGLRRLAVFSGPSPSRVGLSLPGVMDAEGRVDESRLRMHIFKNGGVSPACQRGAVWRFLFGMYPCSSTAQERPLMEQQMAVRYGAMKRRWQHALPSSGRLRLNGTDAELVSAVRYFDQRQASEARRLQAHHDQNAEVRERLAFLELQAQVLLERVTFDLEEVQEAIRIIDKDVPRTNRDLDYYLGEGSGNLLVLRDILITYAAFHPEVSYAQGMNDLCSRFLEVLDCEVDTFWSFSCYMDKFSKDFRADGLHRKIELEAALLKQLDPQLHSHLVTDSMESFTFCHRWLLLGFQREFEAGDALRLFELLSCDHLEFISQQVERARHQERLARKRCCGVAEEQTSASEPHAINTDFTFELFICATILIDNRDALLRCRDDVQLIQFTSSLQGTLDLNRTLRGAEEHLYNYCKRSAWGESLGGCCRARKHPHPHFLYQLRSFFF